MIITHIHDIEEQVEELEKIIRKYNIQRRQKLITPNIFPEDDEEFDLDFFKSNNRVISLEDNNKMLCGLLVYRIFLCKQLYDREDITFSVLPGFRHAKPQEVYANVSEMEAFQTRRGIGRTLMNALKAGPNILGIFLESQRKAQKFYEKMDFRYTGIYNGKNKAQPIMIWNKSGKY